MTKNDLIEITIEDLSKDGEGIGHVDGYTLFIKDALIGDRILARITKAKKTYGFARVERIIEPSPDRCEARCPVARRCGGCRLQELNYEKQLLFKEKVVRDCLVRIGGFPDKDLPLSHVHGMKEPFRYRNKAQYPIGMVKNADGSGQHLAAGFYAGRTHSIVEIMDCVLMKEHNSKILKVFLDWMKRYHIPAYDEKTGKGLVRHLLIREGFSSGEILVCPVINGRKLPRAKELAEALQAITGIKSVCYNINTKPGNVILGGTVVPVLGEPFIEDQLGGLTFRISPLSFYQVNPVQTEALYQKALEAAHLTGREIVYDLYCGIGTISLFMARHAKEVYGVEIVPQAIEDAKRNAAANGIENAHFFCGAAEDLVVSGRFDETHPCPKADVIIVDPPRKGCAPELIDTMLKMAPERIVYVSCDPATLARDLRMLAGDGEHAAYRLESVEPFDLFPETHHVETVVLMSRIEGK